MAVSKPLWHRLERVVRALWSAPTGPSEPPRSQSPGFSVGQVWTFRGAPGPHSRVIIGAVDEDPGGGCIVSIAVTNVPLGELEQSAVFHAPLSEDALAASLIAHVGEGHLPDAFADGYRSWREDYDAGEAGVFSIPVSELLRLYAGLPRWIPT